MPELVELHNEWKDKGVRVQTVSIDIASGSGPDTAQGIADFARKKNITLPILAYSGGVAELAEKYDIGKGIPFTVAFDADGKVVDTQRGGASKERFEEMVNAALAN